jgi:hypothetical protein
LGYPDLLLIDGALPGCPYAEDASRIGRWHGWRGAVYETSSALGLLGCEVEYVDIRPSRGCERVVDLNGPLPDDLVGRFDCVLDAGTVEHCFNVAQAFENCVNALGNEGSVLHVNPLSWVNHGFWSISPGAYADFYGLRGFSVECSVLTGPVTDQVEERIDPYSRIGVMCEASNLVVARRGEGGKPGWPMQRKYLYNPDLKG